MKRLVFLFFLMLTATFAAAAFAQGLMPGPMGACPPMGCQPAAPVCGPPVCPPPVFAPPACGPMMPPPCGAPMCPGATCSIAGMVGYQPNTQPGKMRFTSRNTDQFGVTSTELPFEFQGIWVGAAARAPLSQNIGARVEARNMFPTNEKLESRNTVVLAPELSRSFKSQYVWRVLDGSASWNLSQNFSVLGGVRWDYFDLHLSNPTTIGGFSSPSDEGDLTLSSIIPYMGFESSWTGCTSGLNLRIIATPWISTEHTFGLTYSDPAGLDAVRDKSKGASRFGMFLEGTLQAARKVANVGALGGYLSVQALNSHAERDLTSTMITGGTSTDIAQNFNVDHYRLSLVVGGMASMAFGSPL